MIPVQWIDNPFPVPVPVWSNSGGPATRRRTQRLTSSLLGQRRGHVHCRRAARLALDFGKVDPLDAAASLLFECGFGDVEDASAALLRRESPRLCRAAPELPPLCVAQAEPWEALRQALLLGHCTAFCFDPARPVLWTRASLTRRLELFEAEGFYA